jgi:hypothetical protein
MGKVGKIVSPEKMAIAEKNNIPKTTVYNRVRAGWDVEEAVTKSPRQRNNVKERGEEGNFIAAGVGKGKKRSFALPTDWDDVLDKEIKASGLIQTEYIEKMILNQLKRSKYKKK